MSLTNDARIVPKMQLMRRVDAFDTSDAANTFSKRSDDLVRIEVGPKKHSKTFTTQTKVLSSRSPFFKKALSGDWKEAMDRVIILPDDDPEVFALYMHIIHIGDLPIAPDETPDSHVGHEGDRALAQLYVLAEKFQDTKTKNIVIKAFVVIMTVYRDGTSPQDYLNPRAETVKMIYDGTVTGSLGRKLFVDIYSYNIRGGWDPRDSHWPREFLGELAAELLKHQMLYIARNTAQLKHHFQIYMEKELVMTT